MAASDSSMSMPVQICSGVMAVEISWFQSWKIQLILSSESLKRGASGSPGSIFFIASTSIFKP